MWAERNGAVPVVVKRGAGGDCGWSFRLGQPSHLLLGILGKCWQTGFAGPTAVVGRGSCLLQLAPVRVEKPHSFGASHIVPAE